MHMFGGGARQLNPCFVSEPKDNVVSRVSVQNCI